MQSILRSFISSRDWQDFVFFVVIFIYLFIVVAVNLLDILNVIQFMS